MAKLFCPGVSEACGLPRRAPRGLGNAYRLPKRCLVCFNFNALAQACKLDLNTTPFDLLISVSLIHRALVFCAEYMHTYLLNSTAGDGASDLPLLPSIHGGQDHIDAFCPAAKQKVHG